MSDIIESTAEGSQVVANAAFYCFFECMAFDSNNLNKWFPPDFQKFVEICNKQQPYCYLQELAPNKWRISDEPISSAKIHFCNNFPVLLSMIILYFSY